jgi:hypothetical protein
MNKSDVIIDSDILSEDEWDYIEALAESPACGVKEF